MGLRIARRKAKPVLDGSQGGESVARWWEKVTTNPAFFDIVAYSKTMCKHKPGQVYDQPHQQSSGMSFKEGWDAALDFITNIQVEGSAQALQTYQQDQDLPFPPNESE